MDDMYCTNRLCIIIKSIRRATCITDKYTRNCKYYTIKWKSWKKKLQRLACHSNLSNKIQLRCAIVN